MDALLDHSGSLGIDAGGMADDCGPAQRRAARGSPRPTAMPQTVHHRLQGADLAAFLARQISREEALKRIEVRVF